MSSRTLKTFSFGLTLLLTAMKPQRASAEGSTPAVSAGVDAEDDPDSGCVAENSSKENKSRWENHCREINKGGNWYIEPGAGLSTASLDNIAATGEIAVAYRSAKNYVHIGIRTTPGEETLSSARDVGGAILVPSQSSTSAVIRWSYMAPSDLFPVPIGRAFSTAGFYSVFEGGAQDVSLAENAATGRLSMFRLSIGTLFGLTSRRTAEGSSSTPVSFQVGVGGTLRGISNDDFDKFETSAESNFDGAFQEFLGTNAETWFGGEGRIGVEIGGLEVLMEISALTHKKKQAVGGLTGFRFVPFLSVKAPISLGGK